MELDKRLQPLPLPTHAQEPEEHEVPSMASLEEVADGYRFIDDIPENSAFLEKLTEIGKRVTPDEIKESTVFAIVDSDEVNAFFIPAEKEGEQVYVMAVYKGLIDFAENEDQLAFVLGHEMTHGLIHHKVGMHNNGIGEEFGSDGNSFYLMQKGGYVPEQGLKMLNRICDESNETFDLSALIEDHGLNSNRIVSAEGVLLALDTQQGTKINTEITPISGFDDLSSATHTPFMIKTCQDSNYESLSFGGKLEVLENTVHHLNNPTRLAHWLELLDALDPDQCPPALHERLHTLADCILDENYNREGSLYKPYIQVAESINGIIYKDKSYPLQPVGRMRGISENIISLWNSESTEEAVNHAGALNASIDKVIFSIKGSYFASQDGGKWQALGDLFLIPTPEVSIQNVVDKTVPWEHLTKMATDDQSGQIVSAMLRIGIMDFRPLISRSVVEVRTTMNQAFFHRFRRPEATQVQLSNSTIEVVPDGFGDWVEFEEFDCEGRGFMPSTQYKRISDQFLKILVANERTDFSVIYETLKSQSTSPEKKKEAAKALPQILTSAEERSDLPSLEFSFDEPYLSLALARVRDYGADETKQSIKDYLVGNPKGLLTEQEQRSLYFTLMEPEEIIPIQLREAHEGPGLSSYESEVLRDCRELVGYSAPETSKELLEVLKKITDSVPEEEIDEPEEDDYDDWHFDYEVFETEKDVAETLIETEILLYYHNHPGEELDGEVLEYLGNRLQPLEIRNSGWNETLDRAIRNQDWTNTDLATVCCQFKLFDRKSWFQGDGETYAQLLSQVTERTIEYTQDTGDTTLAAYMLQGLRLSSEASQKLIDCWVETSAKTLGIDDNSEEYFSRVESSLKEVEDIDPIHQRRMKVALSHSIQSQTTVARLLEPDISLDEGTLSATNSSALLIQGVFALVKESPELNEQLIDFLAAPLDCDRAREVSNSINEATSKLNPNSNTRSLLERQLNTPLNVVRLHDSYSDLPSEARAMTMLRLLKNTGKSDAEVNAYVLDKVFGENARGDALVGKELAQAFLSSCLERQRGIILSGMLGSRTQNQDADFRPGALLVEVGEGLKDPAWQRMLQGIHSSPFLSNEMRHDLDAMKEDGNLPTRREVIELFETALDEGTKEGIYLGQVLGAGTYWIYIEATNSEREEFVIGLLRDNVAARANQGFKRLSSALEEYRSNARSGSSSLVTKAVSEAIYHAASQVPTETSASKGYEQTLAAVEFYDMKTIRIDDKEFRFRTAQVTEHGESYKFMEKAEGVSFNKLANTAENESYVKQVAKAYLKVELAGALKGERLDHDRHGGNLYVEKKTDTIGIIDTGARAIQEPSREELQNRGKILFHVLDNLAQGESSDTGLALKNAQSKLKSFPAEQVSEMSRYLLSLNDFTNKLSSEELQELVKEVIKAEKVNDSISKSFLKEAILKADIFKWGALAWENRSLLWPGSKPIQQ